MKHLLATGARARAFTPYVAECYEHLHLDDGTVCRSRGACGRAVAARLKWRERFHNIVTTAGLNALLDNTFNAPAGAANWYVGLIGAGAGTVSETASANSVTGSGTTLAAGLAVSPIAEMIIVGAGSGGADLKTTVASRVSNTSITTTDNALTTVSGASYATEPIAADTLASHINSWSEATPYSNSNRPTWTKNGAAASGAMSNSSSKASFSINADNSRVFGALLANDNTKGGTTGTLYGGGLFSASRLCMNGDTLNVQVDPSLTAS